MLLTLTELTIVATKQFLLLSCSYKGSMFDLLGTPKDQKVLKLYDTDHFIPRNEQIKETLIWLDRYLGPVR